MLWSLTLNDSVKNYRPPSLAQTRDGIFFSTGNSVAGIATDGSVLWRHNRIGSPVAEFHGMVFAASSSGIVEVSRRTGQTIKRLADCDYNSVEWIVPSAYGLLTGCGNRQSGSASIDVTSFGGTLLHRRVFRNGSLTNPSTFRIDERHIWLRGESEVHEFSVIADILDASTSTYVTDEMPAGASASTAYAAGESSAIGSALLTLQSVRLNDGALVSTRFYNPKPGFKCPAGGDQEAYVYRNTVYVFSNKCLYQYALATRPSRQAQARSSRSCRRAGFYGELRAP